MNEWAGKDRTCPHCGGQHAWSHGSFRRKDGSSGRRYLCRTCGRSFSPGTGTAAAYIKKRGSWEKALRSMKDSMPLRQLADSLGVALSTAFRWRHRVLAALAALPKPKLSGFVVLSEYHVPYSEKGSRTARGRDGGDTWWQVGPDGPHRSLLAAKPGRPPIFRSVTHGRGSCILVAQNEGKHLITIAGPGRLKASTLERCLERMIETDPNGRSITEIFSFGNPYYREACRNLGLPYRCGYQEQQRLGTDKILALQRSHDRVRSGVRGWLLPFQGVASRYLHHYLAWYDAVLKEENIETLLAKVRGVGFPEVA